MTIFQDQFFYEKTNNHQAAKSKCGLKEREGGRREGGRRISLRDNYRKIDFSGRS